MRICSVSGCNKKHRTNGYCDKHNKQIRKYGSILERTKHDPNEIIIDNNICRMKLYNQYGKEVMETIFDLKYKEEIEKYKWRLLTIENPYVLCNWIDENKNSHQLYLHQAIVYLSGQEVPDGYEIDHQDGDKLNCLEENLRICTQSQNQQNRVKQKPGVSNYKGIYWHSRDKKWYARIILNHKRINLGSFNDPKDAARAYNTAAIKYFNEFANLNQI